MVELRTGRVLNRGFSGVVRAISPDGKRLAVRVNKPGRPNSEGKTVIFDLASGEGVAETGAWLGNEARFSPDSRRLLAAVYPGIGPKAGTREKQIRVVETRTGRTARRIERRRDAFPIPVALSPDDRLVAVAESHEPVRLIDIATGRTVARFTSAGGPVCDLSFAPDGKTPAGTTPGLPVVLWDVPEVSG